MKKVHQILFKNITILDFVEREAHKVQDDLHLESIRAGGIQQPMCLVRDGEKLLLSKGWNRIRMGRLAGLVKGPAVIVDAPKDVAPETYARRLRLKLDLHRQDLLPTQKAEFVAEIKQLFGFNNRQVAKFIGCTADTITNITAVTGYIEPVRQALDAGVITGNRARVLDGLTTTGQEAVWKRHGKDLIEVAPKVMYTKVRREFAPQSFPQFYRDAEASAKRLARPPSKRRVNRRATQGREDRSRLADTLEMREIELRTGSDELAQLKREIQAAIVPVGAILRNEQVKAALSPAMRAELERFAEVYV